MDDSLGSETLDASFDASFDDLFDRAHRLAYRLVGQAETAEDIAAETMAHARRRGTVLRRLRRLTTAVVSGLAATVVVIGAVGLVPVDGGGVDVVAADERAGASEGFSAPANEAPPPRTDSSESMRCSASRARSAGTRCGSGRTVRSRSSRRRSRGAVPGRTR